MGKIVHKNQPCLDDKCGSSDARQVYEDGTHIAFLAIAFSIKKEQVVL